MRHQRIDGAVQRCGGACQCVALSRDLGTRQAEPAPQRQRRAAATSGLHESFDGLRQGFLQFAGVRLDARHVACAQSRLQVIEMLLDALQHRFEFGAGNAGSHAGRGRFAADGRVARGLCFVSSARRKSARPISARRSSNSLVQAHLAPVGQPVAAAPAERACAAQARADADQRDVDASRAIVAQIESAFSDAGDLMQQAREFVVAAGNTSYGPHERRGIAQQLAAIRTQLLQVANRGDGAGGFLFSGQGTGAPPFVDAPGGVGYGATAGTTHTASSEPLPLAEDGRAAFLEARSGNGEFVTAAGSVAVTGWIDAGGVVDLSQLTGLPYSVQFSVGVPALRSRCCATARPLR